MCWNKIPSKIVSFYVKLKFAEVKKIKHEIGNTSTDTL